MRRVGYREVAPGQRMAPPAGFREARRQQARPATVESDATTPFLQAVATGVMASVATAAVGLLTGWRILDYEWEWYLPLAVGGVAMAGTWLVLLNGHRRMLWMVETIVGQGLDEDGVEGPPPLPELPSPARTVPVEVRREDMGRTIQRDELPEPRPGALGEFMVAVREEYVSFSERGAAEYGYCREMWLDLRQRFLSRRWVEWRVPGSERQGLQLTLPGRAVVRGLAAPPLPLPASGEGNGGAWHARTHDARREMAGATGPARDSGTDNRSYVEEDNEQDF